MKALLRTIVLSAGIASVALAPVSAEAHDHHHGHHWHHHDHRAWRGHHHWHHHRHWHHRDYGYYDHDDDGGDVALGIIGGLAGAIIGNAIVNGQ